MKKTVFYCLIFFFLFSCKKNDDKTGTATALNTFELKAGDCKELLDRTSVCFDSVLNDSRCPIGATCFWAGNAVVKLGITKDQTKHVIKLNTLSSFQTDTTIDNLYISLVELTPYPNIQTNSRDSGKVKLTIADLDKLKSNAKVLGPSTDKCQCCWGWTIKIGNDTIMSSDNIIGQKIGYNNSTPIAVYIELGEIETTCSNNGNRNHYKINQIIKTR
ncbi:hypothetical protein [Pinibacter soli]|uniref:Lipoprotein n=1 Tax=Pinibacter soli TaxID=3044211 RepID=A0ABT6R866_9BACT|nr:hypothetical protein [Pinibacter soli]MDI3318661.1 hypothetical protein [Pinibacter soli]